MFQSNSFARKWKRPRPAIVVVSILVRWRRALSSKPISYAIWWFLPVISHFLRKLFFIIYFLKNVRNLRRAHDVGSICWNWRSSAVRQCSAWIFLLFQSQPVKWFFFSNRFTPKLGGCSRCFGPISYIVEKWLGQYVTSWMPLVPPTRHPTSHRQAPSASPSGNGVIRDGSVQPPTLWKTDTSTRTTEKVLPKSRAKKYDS